MSPRRRTTDDRLRDILSAISRVRRAEVQLLAAERAGEHDAASVALEAVLYNLVGIGEAVNALPTDVTADETVVPWRDVVDMRNFLAHEYFRVHPDVVLRTIDAPLRVLERECARSVRPPP